MLASQPAVRCPRCSESGCDDSICRRPSLSSYTAFLPSVKNTPTSGTYASLGGTFNTYQAALIPAGYMSYQLSPNLWLGMSLNSPFGLSVGFPETWAGRDYAAGDTSLRTYNVAPSIAYRFNDWISVGVGVQIQYAKAALNHGVSRSFPKFYNCPLW